MPDNSQAAHRPSMSEAQLTLGQLALERGEHDAAFGFFTAAARSGDAHGFNMLGRAFERGWGTTADSRKAADYYRKAADLGDVWAMFNLADLFCRGEGVDHDEEAAFHLYSEAARRGHVKSLNMLALFYEDGRLVAKDLGKAHELYRAGAEGGDCWAGFNLARLEAAAGSIDAAVDALGDALTNGFADFYRHVADCFGEHHDPRLMAIARHAALLADRAK